MKRYFNKVRILMIFFLFSAVVLLTLITSFGVGLSQLSIMSSYQPYVNSIFGIKSATAPIDVMKTISNNSVLWIVSLYSGLFLALYEKKNLG